MLAQDDLQFILQNLEKNAPLPITIDKIYLANNETKNVIFNVKLTATANLPIANQPQVVVPVYAETFHYFTKCCGDFAISPVFPEKLITTFRQDITPFYQSQVNMFFDIAMKTITVDPKLRDSFVIRSLLCKPNEIALQEFQASIKENEKSRLAKKSKLIALNIMTDAKKGMKDVGKTIKSFFQNLAKDETAESQATGSMEGKGHSAEKGEGFMEEALKIGKQLAQTDAMLKIYSQYLSDQSHRLKAQLNDISEFASSQATCLSYLNTIPNYLKTMMVYPLSESAMVQHYQLTVDQIDGIQIPLIEMIIAMVEQVLISKLTHDTTKQDLDSCLEKLGATQADLAKTGKANASKFQKITEQMNEYITRSSELKKQKVEHLDTLKQQFAVLESFLESELKAGFKNIFDAIKNEGSSLLTSYQKAGDVLQNDGVCVKNTEGKLEVFLK